MNDREPADVFGSPSTDQPPFTPFFQARRTVARGGSVRVSMSRHWRAVASPQRVPGHCQELTNGLEPRRPSFCVDGGVLLIGEDQHVVLRLGGVVARPSPCSCRTSPR